MVQCSRKPWRDGYCKQHHPDTVKARNEASQARYDAKSAKWKSEQEASKVHAEKVARALRLWDFLEKAKLSVFIELSATKVCIMHSWDMRDEGKTLAEAVDKLPGEGKGDANANV
jgi:hypothetical protein